MPFVPQSENVKCYPPTNFCMTICCWTFLVNIDVASNYLRLDFILMLWHPGSVLVRLDEKTTCFICLSFNFKENDAASPASYYLSRHNVLVKPGSMWRTDDSSHVIVCHEKVIF